MSIQSFQQKKKRSYYKLQVFTFPSLNDKSLLFHIYLPQILMFPQPN